MEKSAVSEHFIEASRAELKEMLDKIRLCALLIDATPFGVKALTTAMKKYAGESAAIQRCQVHKRRNVLDHLTDERKPGVAKRLNATYALEDYALQNKR